MESTWHSYPPILLLLLPTVPFSVVITGSTATQTLATPAVLAMILAKHSRHQDCYSLVSSDCVGIRAALNGLVQRLSGHKGLSVPS